jgi:lipopolysaccharide export system protein LptA
MALPVYHLRRLLAATAILISLVVAGMYFYARSKTTNILKTIPGKIGYDIKQTAHGFQFSKSDGKRTLFTVQASDIKEFKLNGNAELHNVSIVLYGRDSSRFDQIYGDDFAFNQATGDVTAKGDVQIDLVANPAGLASADQATPKELTNPIHLKTRDLVFNKDTGNASTDARVEFRTPQASGWAVGVQYAGKSNKLTLASQIHVVLTGPDAAVIEAEHGVITGDPRQAVLEHAHLKRGEETLAADEATFFLDAQNRVQRVLASGDVTTDVIADAKKSNRRRSDAAAQESATPSRMHGRADQAEFEMSGDELLHTANFSGHVHFDQVGPQAMQGEAGRVIVDFAGKNKVQKIHAIEGARLKQVASQAATAAKPSAGEPAAFELTAAGIDFDVKGGHVLRHASTVGAAQMTIAQASAKPAAGPQTLSAQRTVVTAGKFDADFAATDGHSRLSHVHGAPDARIVSSNAGQPDRVSTSTAVDAVFLPQGGIDSITQTGNFVYTDGATAKPMQAWANLARYTPVDQMLLLTGDPRVTNGGMQTAAEKIRIDRSTGDAIAEGSVKSTYSELKEQPDGALLASASPIHVTANSMTAHSNPGIAVYSGKARLWQDANVIEAPTIQFDRDRRSVTAQGTAAQPVQTILVQSEKKPGADQPAKKPLAASTAVAITGQKLTYIDAERRIHYEGGVAAKGADFNASAKVMDAFLVPFSQSGASQSPSGQGQLDRMVAEGSVIIQQPSRRAEGQKLVYTAADDKFVLTGGSSGTPPSIFDAEQGKITGVSLTFFRRDDRVLVEGGASTPVVTTTRMAR